MSEVPSDDNYFVCRSSIICSIILTCNQLHFLDFVTIEQSTFIAVQDSEWLLKHVVWLSTCIDVLTPVEVYATCIDTCLWCELWSLGGCVILRSANARYLLSILNNIVLLIFMSFSTDFCRAVLNWLCINSCCNFFLCILEGPVGCLCPVIWICWDCSSLH